MNDTLTQRLLSQPSLEIEEQTRLVREAMFQHHAEALQELERAGERIERQDKRIEEQDGIIKELREQVELLKQEGDERRATERRMSFILKWVPGPLLLTIFAGLGIAALLSSRFPQAFWVIATGFWGVGFLGLVWLIDWRGNRVEAVSNWKYFQRFHKAKNWVFALLSFLWILVVAVISNILTEWAKQRFPQLFTLK